MENFAKTYIENHITEIESEPHMFFINLWNHHISPSACQEILDILNAASINTTSSRCRALEYILAQEMNMWCKIPGKCVSLISWVKTILNWKIGFTTQQVIDYILNHIKVFNNRCVNIHYKNAIEGWVIES